MKSIRVASAFVAGLVTALLFASVLRAGGGDEPQDGKPPVETNGETGTVDEKVKARQDFVIRASRRFDLTVGPEKTVSKLNQEPLLIWSNPVSGTRSGILVMYTRTGRPDVFAQFSYPGTTMVHEFHACIPDVTLSRGGNTVWTPESASPRWLDLKTDEPPAATPALRLVQMRRLTGLFTIKDNFGWTSKELHTLRPLSQPVHRYGKAGEETVDGAVFIYALSTDPEAALMLECHQTDAGLAWRYALAPITIYELTATLDGKVVWEVPERRIFNNVNAVQFVGPYRLEPGETTPE